MAAIKLTVITSFVIVAINAVMGTMIAWVLVRDEFRGKSIVNSLIDLLPALPTIVAGLTLLALYGQDSPLGINITYTKVAVGMALLFVTLPFVVRAMQPVLRSSTRRWRRRLPRWVEQLPDLPQHHPPQPDAGDHRRAARWPSPARSASSARWC